MATSVLWPLANAAAKITSPFGLRTAPKAGASTDHKGVDISAVTGTQVYAANGGTVDTGYNSTSGNWVSITGADGVKTVYRHLQTAQVTKGQSVAAGSPIALSGATGNVTGPHLHFEVLVNGQYVDPMQLVSKAAPASTTAAAPASSAAAAPDVQQLAKAVTDAVGDIEKTWPVVLAALAALGLLLR